jgi:hypothetical protein
MLNFIVLGIVPGTSIELTLNWLLLISGVIAASVFIRNELKSRRAKQSEDTVDSISQLA